MGEAQTLKKVEGTLKFLESKNDKLQPVELWCLNEKVNRNNWKYLNIRDHLSQFADIPILIAYEMGGQRIGAGHNMTRRIDPKTGKEYMSFTDADAERIVGWIDKDDKIEIRQDEKGIDWVVCSGALWKFYCAELVGLLREQGLEGMNISIETLITSEDIVDGVAYENDYIVLGVSILGQGVAPAVESASIRTLSHLSDIRGGMKEIVMKAASYSEESGKVQGKNNSNKGEKAVVYFSRKQCAELSKRFDGYTVLAAGQDDNGIHVALLSKDGDTAVYNMNSVDETIAVEKIRSCEGQVAFDCGDEQSLCIGLDEVMADMNSAIEKANSERDTAQAEANKANEALAAANSTITDMRNAENARRVLSAKAVAVSTLNEYNASSPFAIPEKVLEAVNADIDAGVYTSKVNADGSWAGEDEVRQRVMAICGAEAMKANKAEQEKNRTVFAWDKIGLNHESDDSVSGLLRRIGVKE